MKKKISLFLSALILSLLFFISPTEVAAQDCSPSINCPAGYHCVLEPMLNYQQGWCVEDGDTTENSLDNNLEETSNVNVDLSQYLTLRDGQKVSEVFSKPSDLVNLLVRLVFVVAGLIIFLMVVIAGISMIAGNGKDMEKAKTTMTNAGIGFILLFAAYWIMQIIAQVTGTNIGF